ncbi:MAG: methyltransferase domain-containing protein [Nitrosopumilus sp.]|nr:methyltransferase domain-containing protein [Nitrosopumilus sp.]
MKNNDEEYDSFNNTYDEKPEMFGHPYKELQDYFNKSTKRGTLLDLGCGQGRDSIYLSSLGYQVTAVDISKVGINQMRNKAQSQGLEIDGIVHDIQNLKLQRKFDVILFDMLLHGFENQIQLELLGKYSNSLNKDGILCIIYPDDFQAEHFMNLLKSLPTNWNLLEEITVNDVPKIEGEAIDFKFKMMVAQLS